MNDPEFELPVSVREYGGAYIARCQGKIASCTSRPEEAMQSAAAKAINASGKLKRVVTPAEVILRKRCGDRVGLHRAFIAVESGVPA